MKYRCELCKHKFETEGSKTADRCPSCLRKNGLAQVGPSKPAAGQAAPAWRLPAIAGAVVLGLVGAYTVLSPTGPTHDPEGPVPLVPLSVEDIDAFASQKDVRLRGLQDSLNADDTIEGFAEAAAGDATDEDTIAGAVVSALTARREAQAFVPWSRSSPRDTAPRAAPDTATRINTDEGRARLYPLEVAIFAVAALRSIDVPAMVTEVYKYPNEETPPDPNGHLGYFGFATPAGEDEWHHFDPYGGRDEAPEDADVRVLNDVQVVAALLSHQAEFNLVHEADERRALEQSTEAVRLDPRSPSIRTVRGAVLLGSGAGPDGVEELETAAQLRRDGVRRNNLAGIFLAQGDEDRAQREVGIALEEFPEFAAGHATLGALAMQRGEFDEAERALQTAERLDPELVNLSMLWANFHLMRGNVPEAIQHAEIAVERRPHQVQSRLTLARILRQAGRYDDMRLQAREVMQLTPTSRREQMQMLIRQLLGPTALEEPMDEEIAVGDDWDDEPSGSADDLQLAEPSTALGGGDDNDGPSLLGDDELMGGGGLPNAGDPSTLRLRDPTDGLRLQL